MTNENISDVMFPFFNNVDVFVYFFGEGRGGGNWKTNKDVEDISKLLSRIFSVQK